MSLRVLNAAWLPRVPMIGISKHWTAGGHKASATDLKHYHILTENPAKLVRGVNITLNSGTVRNGYAAHTRGLNSGRIGMSMCGMMGAVEHPFNAGRAPLTLAQWNMDILATADLCEVYKIGVSLKGTFFHFEAEEAHGVKQAGKWDVARLPFDHSVRGKQIGEKMRDEVSSALRGNGPMPLPQPEPLPAALEGATGRVVSNSNLNFRRGPGVAHESTGSLPPGTIITVLASQGDWLRVRTPAGFEGWVHGGYVQLIDTAPLPEPTVPDPLHRQFDDVRALLAAVEANMPDDRDTLARMLRNMASDLETYT